MSDGLTEFQAWPKTPRLFRDIVVTEKIDGTNAAVMIRPTFYAFENGSTESTLDVREHEVHVVVDGIDFAVGAQSRNRLIWPGKGTDNAGFAAWVHAHAEDLVKLLGIGRHFGEWWGKGIQRNYGLDHKRFSLFNVSRFAGLNVTFEDGTVLNTVPVLYSGEFAEESVRAVSDLLASGGSIAAPGFKDPEGIIVYHSAIGRTFKCTLDGDGHKNSKES